MSYSIEQYGGGFLVADYSGNRGKFGAAYAGENGEWRDQPIIDAPFDTESAAKGFIKFLDK